MITYQNFKKEILFEERNQSGHITHFEDVVFYQGSKGVKQALNLIQILLKNPEKLNLSFKADGSPSVFFGPDPSDGKFFVAKKSIFNKEPKIYKTHDAIDTDNTGDLAHKLHYAFHYLKATRPQSILQGDMLYTKKSLKEKNINGRGYLTFHPNTITYAIELEDPTAQKLYASEMGIILHTKWIGRDLKSLKPVYKIDDSDYKKTKGVWIKKPYLDGSKLNFKSSTSSDIEKLIKKALQLLPSVSKYINQISSNQNLAYAFEAYHNQLIRQGHVTSNSLHYVNGLVQFVKNKFPKYGSYLQDMNALAKVFELHSLMSEIKQKIVDSLNNRELELKAFIHRKNGVVNETEVEGYIAIGDDNKPLKFVNRLEFSKHNFDDENIQKGWIKQK